MSTILDYLAEEFSTFEELSFNALDAVILSQMAMVRLEGIEPDYAPETLPPVGEPLARALPSPLRFSDLLRAESYATMFTGLDSDNVKQCMLAVAASPRFRKMRITHYASILDDERDVQFSAMAFTYRDQFSFIAFRGTDKSLTGWRENFQMSYMDEIPAQAEAREFVAEIADDLPGCLYIGGHSKGGNLAEYVLLRADDALRRRITMAFNFDGPGFRFGRFAPEDYEPIVDKLAKYVPVDSTVGVLLESFSQLSVVASTGWSVGQHSVFTWETEGSAFVEVAGLCEDSRYREAVMDGWIQRYPDDSLAKVTDIVFGTLEAADAGKGAGLFAGGKKTVETLLAAAQKCAPEDVSILLAAAGDYAEVMAEQTRAEVASRAESMAAALTAQVRQAAEGLLGGPADKNDKGDKHDKANKDDKERQNLIDNHSH